MVFDFADEELSVLRSRARRHVLRDLLRVPDAFAGQIAARTGLTPFAVDGALHGYADRYRRELSLLRLRLVEERRGPNGLAYALTQKGRAVALRIDAAAYPW